MANAAVLKTAGGNPLRVRVPSPAPPDNATTSIEVVASMFMAVKAADSLRLIVFAASGRSAARRQAVRGRSHAGQRTASQPRGQDAPH